MRAQGPTQDLNKFPIHLTGVNPHWKPAGRFAAKPRLAAYRLYKLMRAVIEKEHEESGSTERITHNKVFDRMRSGNEQGFVANSLRTRKRYSKVMLYSIVELFTIIDSPQGHQIYRNLERIRALMIDDLPDDQQAADKLVISAFLDQIKVKKPAKLHTREALRDVLSLYENAS